MVKDLTVGAMGGWPLDPAKLNGVAVQAVFAAIFWPKEARKLVVANFWQGEVHRELVTLQQDARELVGAELRPRGKV